MKTFEMKEAGLSLSARFQQFPWLLIDLIFPFMMEYLVSRYALCYNSTTTLISIARMVSYLGDHPQCPRRVDIFC